MPGPPIVMCVVMHYPVSPLMVYRVRCANVKCINDVQRKRYQTVNGRHWQRLEKILLRTMMETLLCRINGWKGIYQWHRHVSYVRKRVARCYAYKIGDVCGVCEIFLSFFWYKIKTNRKFSK